jgi:histidyl-tRNA synthetase
LEYADILLGKGGGETEKQIYRFNDNGGRDIALRFDLTVPLARFLAEHRAELAFPFKRYHIAKVWRGEKAQRGRYREFTQCDFDIVGSDSASADFEILLMMRNTLRLIGAGEVTIKINHRGLFNRFLNKLDIADKSVEILRTVDKLAKIGHEETCKQLSQLTDDKKEEEIIKLLSVKGNIGERLETITTLSGGNSPESERLSKIYRFMKDTGTDTSFILDSSITRGLDYYTGIVYETFLNSMPEIGSVCSGGRYDNLVALYSKESICGVGSSIGLDRLLAALETLGTLNEKAAYTDVAIACIKEEDSGIYQAIAEKLREKEISCEVFLEEGKLTKQYMLAEKKGAKWLIIADKKEEGTLTDNLTLRNLEKRENLEALSLDELVNIIKSKRFVC